MDDKYQIWSFLHKETQIDFNSGLLVCPQPKRQTDSPQSILESISSITFCVTNERTVHSLSTCRFLCIVGAKCFLFIHPFPIFIFLLNYVPHGHGRNNMFLRTVVGEMLGVYTTKKGTMVDTYSSHWSTKTLYPFIISSGNWRRSKRLYSELFWIQNRFRYLWFWLFLLINHNKKITMVASKIKSFN